MCSSVLCAAFSRICVPYFPAFSKQFNRSLSVMKTRPRASFLVTLPYLLCMFSYCNEYVGADIHRPIRTSVRILIWQDYTRLTDWLRGLFYSIYGHSSRRDCSIRSMLLTSSDIKTSSYHDCTSAFVSAFADGTSDKQDSNITCITAVIIPTTRNRNITLKQQHNDFNRYCLLITLHSPNLSVSTL